MGVIITGTSLGDRKRNGTLDNGQPWNVHELMVLDGLEVTPVRIDRFPGSVPTRGEVVALHVELRSGKFHATGRDSDIEAGLSANA